MLATSSLFLLALAGPGHRSCGAGGELADVRAVLLRTSELDRPTEAELLRRLTALGSSATPALFSLVTGEALEEFLGPDDAPLPWLCPPDRVGELALAALAKFPPASVIEHLRARAAEQPERDVLVAEARVLGRLASAHGLELLLELAHGFGYELMARPVRAPLSEALVAILLSDPKAFRLLEGRAQTLALEEQRFLCEALTATGEAEAAALLLELLGHDVELDLAALAGLTELDARYPWRMHFDLVSELRPRLASPDARVRAQCAQALGRLRDGAAVPALIARLEDADAGVARAARWSLRELSGRKDLERVEDWKSWYMAELAWWSNEGQALCQNLAAAPPSALSSNLRLLLAHPLARGPAAEALIGALPGLSTEGRALVCRMLAQFGSRQVVPALVELLGEERAVSQAAWETLRALTGENLPPEPRMWEHYAFG